MRPSYSLRAFLITTMLFGILVLILISIKLSGDDVSEKIYDLEDITLAELPPQEKSKEELAKAETPNRISTNKAYNEAEKFLSKQDNDTPEEITETTEGKLQQMNEAIEGSANNTAGKGISFNKKPEKKEPTSNGKNATTNITKANSGNRNTTISYQLVNRTAIALPNPVYTCNGAGKVVISIEVNEQGSVVKTTYSKGASTTTNECLIDMAIEYSRQAYFTKDTSKNKQLGTITFNFPGQG